MYEFFRGALLVILAIMALLFYKRIKTVDKWIRVTVSVILIVATCAVSVLYFVPVENSFVTFDSAEAVYKYRKFGSYDVHLVVEGKESDFVVGESNKNHDVLYMAVPKTEDGWKIGCSFDLDTVCYKRTDYGTIDVCRFKKTNDYFIIYSSYDDTDQQLTDNRNSQFIKLSDDVRDGEYYAFVPDFDSNYRLVINGNIITFENDDKSN